MRAEEEEEAWDDEQDDAEEAEQEGYSSISELTEAHEVQLRIHSALRVPKVDTFSESDPYVVLRLPDAGRDAPRTITIQDEPNPVWEEDFFFECLLMPDGRLQGSVDLEVWDEDMVSDSIIGKATLVLDDFDPMDWHMIELPLVLTDKVQAKVDKLTQQQNKRGLLSMGRKQPQASTSQVCCVYVSIVGCIPAFSSMERRVAQFPGAVIDPRARMVLTPIAGHPLLAGTQYGHNHRKGPRYVLLSTQQWTTHRAGLRLDYDLPPDAALPDGPEAHRANNAAADGDHGGADKHSSRRSSHEQPRSRGGSNSGEGASGGLPSSRPSVLASVVRMQWPRGRKLTPELRVYEEVALVDLPLSVDLREVYVTLAPKSPPAASYDAGALLAAAGWQGPGLSYKLALNAMRDHAAGCSSSQQEIYVTPDDELPVQCVLALDFRGMEATPLGPTPHIVAYPNRDSSLCWELSGEGEVATQVQELIYIRSVKLLKGDARVRARRRLQLVDTNGALACQERLGGALRLAAYELDEVNQVVWPLIEVLCGQHAVEIEDQKSGGGKGKGSKALSKVTKSIRLSFKGLGDTILALLGLGRRAKRPVVGQEVDGSAPEWGEAKKHHEGRGHKGRRQRDSPGGDEDEGVPAHRQSSRRRARDQSGEGRQVHRRS